MKKDIAISIIGAIITIALCICALTSCTPQYKITQTQISENFFSVVRENKHNATMSLYRTDKCHYETLTEETLCVYTRKAKTYITFYLHDNINVQYLVLGNNTIVETGTLDNVNTKYGTLKYFYLIDELYFKRYISIRDKRYFLDILSRMIIEAEQN